jgi:hypothetical protein
VIHPGEVAEGGRFAARLVLHAAGAEHRREDLGDVPAAERLHEDETALGRAGGGAREARRHQRCGGAADEQVPAGEAHQ